MNSRNSHTGLAQCVRRRNARDEEDEFLTLNELGAWLKLNPKTIRNKMSAGIFKKDVHYYSPPGLQTHFIRLAILKWLKAEETAKKEITFPLPDGFKENIKSDFAKRNAKK